MPFSSPSVPPLEGKPRLGPAICHIPRKSPLFWHDKTPPFLFSSPFSQLPIYQGRQGYEISRLAQQREMSYLVVIHNVECRKIRVSLDLKELCTCNLMSRLHSLELALNLANADPNSGTLSSSEIYCAAPVYLQRWKWAVPPSGQSSPAPAPLQVA